MIWYLGSEPLQKNQECAVPLGVQGEDAARIYTADVSDWLSAYPLGIIVLVLQAPDGSAPYMADTSTDTDAGIVSWTVTNFDTAVVGYGKGELRLVADGAVLKSYTFKTYTKPSVLMCVADPPAPVPEWATEILQTAEQTAINAHLAEVAQAGAEAAQNAAQAAQAAAETAQTGAEVAKAGAEAAEANAETLSSRAGVAASTATSAKNAAIMAQAAAETAQGKAETAQAAAETAQGKAETAQAAAETAQGLAEAAQTAAEAAQTAAEAAAASLVTATAKEAAEYLGF